MVSFDQYKRATMITKAQALRVVKKFHLDLDVVPIDQILEGLNAELEHGSKLGSLTNITKDKIDTTARIVIAHLIEDPQYYKYLKPFENRRERYWKKKRKPSIFIN